MGARRGWAVLASVALAWGVTAGGASAGLFHGPWDLSLGPYLGGPGYSYNVAYGYMLPFSQAEAASIWTYPNQWPFFPYYANPYYVGGKYHHGVYAPDWMFELEPVPDRPGDPEPRCAVVQITVPEGAEVWFDGNLTRQTGARRTFSSPLLEPGTAYHYEVRARWLVNGKPMEQTQAVGVRAGEHHHILFPLPAPKPAAAP
jgi:uncharacterized protein (TIGR03000 family)